MTSDKGHIKGFISRLKPYLRWVILGGTLFFLAKTLKDRGAEVMALEITGASWFWLFISLCITMLAHIWSGWVWIGILRELGQRVPVVWGLRVYLRTNIAKYLPGNVWHFYGRVAAVKEKNISLSIGTLSVLMEPLLMAAGALILALVGYGEILGQFWPVLGLVGVLAGLHPRFFNPVVGFVGKLKLGRSPGPESGLKPNYEPPQIRRYPILPLLGEMGFLLLRGSGFVLAVMAMLPPSQHLTMEVLPVVFGGFSMSWLLGLVVPGAPGGVGVFEATAVGLLQTHLPTGVLLGAIAFYRLISILAEAVTAALAGFLPNHRPH